MPGSPLRPAPGSEDYLRYRYYLHYAEGSLMPLMVMALVFGSISRAPMPFFIKPIAKQIVQRVRGSFLTPQTKTHLDFIESELKAHPWFAGDAFTAADVQMSFPLEAAAMRAGADSYPKIADWLSRIHGRPAYERALDKGGKYEVGSFYKISGS